MLYFKPDGMLSAWRFLSRVLSDMTKIFTQFNNLMLFFVKPSAQKERECVVSLSSLKNVHCDFCRNHSFFASAAASATQCSSFTLAQSKQQCFAANILTLRWWTLSLKIVSSAFPCSFFFKHCAIFCSSCTVMVWILVL